MREGSPPRVTVMVGGVGALYQGDLDVGRRAIELLAQETLGSHVLVEDLYHGAVDVVRMLEDLQPQALVLVGAEVRNRPAGTVERRRLPPVELSTDEARLAVGEALTGYVTIDLLVEVASAFGALPPHAVAVEVEPASTELSERLSPAAQVGLVSALDLVRTEIDRSGLFALAGQLRELVAGDRLERSPALQTMEDLLAEVALLDREGRWGRTFGLRDRLRLDIGRGGTGEGMEYLDWGLWWALVEELDRLQALESTAPRTSAR